MQWVSELAAKLCHNDVNATFDQQGLGLGTGLAQFMEVGVRDCDRVLVICTDNYVRKANNRGRRRWIRDRNCNRTACSKFRN